MYIFLFMIFPFRPPLDLQSGALGPAFFARRDGRRHGPGVLGARSPRRFQQVQGRAPVPFAGLGGPPHGAARNQENHGKTMGKP